MNFIIDRIEGNKAILEKEEGCFIEVPKEILPPNCKVSDIIRIEKNDKETQKRKEAIETLMKDVWE